MLVDYLKGIIDGYADTEQCGQCWKFIHARRDYSNLYEPIEGEQCCTHFMLETYSVLNNYNQDDLGYGEVASTDFSFNAFVGVHSDLDRAYDSELGNESDEGKYEKYIKPIEDCMMDGFAIDFCEEINEGSASITRWQIDNKINYKDSNFDGVMISGTIRVSYL